jgi:hypothetical protein
MLHTIETNDTNHEKFSAGSVGAGEYAQIKFLTVRAGLYKIRPSIPSARP